jgi:chromate transporter
LAQTLPGLSSSQVGISVGILRTGLPGGVAAWLGFTLPSAIAMVVFASVVQSFGHEARGWLHGLQVVAVADVALAVRGTASTLPADRPRATIDILAAIVTIAWSSTALAIAAGQVLVIGASRAVGWRLLRYDASALPTQVSVPIGGRTAALALAACLALLVGLPLLRQVTQNEQVAVFDSCNS